MRSFNKKEIQKILAKAAEMEMLKSLDDDHESLTEQEILDLAKETGISDNSIKTAIHSFDTPQFQQSFSWLKGTSKLEHVEYFDSELQSDQIAKVLRLLQTMEDELGEAELHPKNLNWSTQRELESLKVTLQEENKKTSFTYSKKWTELKIIVSIFPFMLGLIATLVTLKGMGFDKFTALGFSPFGGLVGLAASWIYLKSKFESQKNRLQETLSQIRTLFTKDNHNDSRIVIEEESTIPENSNINKSKIRS